MIKPKIDQLREASDQELAELFASWFYDCKERLCPIAIEMECTKRNTYVSSANIDLLKRLIPSWETIWRSLWETKRCLFESIIVNVFNIRDLEDIDRYFK